MRLVLLILPFFFSCLSFGQDSLQLDKSNKVLPSTVQVMTIEDSTSSTLKDSIVKKKKQKKKVKRLPTIDTPIVSKVVQTKNIDNTSSNKKVLIIIGLLFVGTIVFLAFPRLSFSSTNEHKTTVSKDNELLSDFLSRITLSRRDYYRNVYLKSEAWKRKRYLVLKRDNWRCVYCGEKATEVHHTRYAKVNIGKEPIDWLVSICRTCHDSKHMTL